MHPGYLFLFLNSSLLTLHSAHPHLYLPSFFSNPQLTLTQDIVATNRALETYRDLDPAFAGTREHALLVDLAEAVEQGDQEAFADKLFQFDQMSKLDKWKTTILLRVKNTIEERGEDFS